MEPAMKGPGSSATGSTGGATAYYPSTFQNHIDQLEQEYDAQADMIDDQDPSDQSAGPGPYPAPFSSNMHHVGQHPIAGQNLQGQQQPIPHSGDTNGPVFGAMNQLYDPFDPNLDADPFGLSASMHFPTQLSFETSSMR